MTWSWEMFQQLPIEEARQVTQVWLRRAGNVKKISKKASNKELFDICTEARAQALQQPKFILGRLANRVDALIEEIEPVRNLIPHSDIYQRLQTFKEELTDARKKA